MQYCRICQGRLNSLKLFAVKQINISSNGSESRHYSTQPLFCLLHNRVALFYFLHGNLAYPTFSTPVVPAWRVLLVLSSVDGQAAGSVEIHYKLNGIIFSCAATLYPTPYFFVRPWSVVCRIVEAVRGCVGPRGTGMAGEPSNRIKIENPYQIKPNRKKLN